jgi:hypothetical protein
MDRRAAGALCGGALLLGGTLWLAQRSEQVDLLRFPLCWAGVLALLDGAGRARRGRSALPSLEQWLWAGAGSLLFWDLFELVNLRLRNWWYTGIAGSLLESWAFGAISFATVLPALRLLEHVAAPPPEPPRPSLRPALPLLLLGVALLALALAFPRFAFPLAWLFLWPLCEAALRALPFAPGAPSPLQSWEQGDRARLLRLCALGLLLGLLWESLNWRCARGWVYTVPFFEHGKLFEMPLPGYAGYLPFALECAAALALLDRVRGLISRRAALGALAGLLLLHLLLEATAFPRSTLSRFALRGRAGARSPGDGPAGRSPARLWARASSRDLR